MNIFVLDENPSLAAEYQCDKHVVKMILETAQLLSAAHHHFDPEGDHSDIYKKTHFNHPCSVWVRESDKNYAWLVYHGIALADEYTRRYKKEHKSGTLIRGPLELFPRNMPVSPERTPFKLCMPDEYKRENPVEAYRAYYRGEKRSIAKWKLGNVPSWFNE